MPPGQLRGPRLPVGLPALLGALIAVIALGVTLAAVSGRGRPPPPASSPTPGPNAVSTASPTTEQPSSGPTATTSTVTVVIDPGHNGQNWAHAGEIGRTIKVPTGEKPCDTAGAATASGYTESAYNLDVASLLGPILSARGIHVLPTRTSDNGWGPCIDERVAVANRAHADATVSIHADGWLSGRGFYVLYAAPAPGSPDVNNPLAVASKRLAIDIRDAFAQGTGLPYSTYGGRDGLLAVPWPTLYSVPEVLIETGNMRNPTDARLLQDPAFRQRAAEALAAGLGAYLAGR